MPAILFGWDVVAPSMALEKCGRDPKKITIEALGPTELPVSYASASETGRQVK